MDEIKPSINGMANNSDGTGDKTDSGQYAPPPQITDLTEAKVHQQDGGSDLSPEPRDPNSGRMTFLTAIIAVATVINVGVFWYESEDTSGKIETLSSKAGEIVNTMNTALSNNRSDISKAFDANREAVEASERQSKAALNASVQASRNDQRAWFGIKEITLATPLTVGKPVQMSVVGLNTGKTPALDLSVIEVRVGPSETDRSRDFVINIPDHEVVAPNNTDVFYATVTYDDESLRRLSLPQSKSIFAAPWSIGTFLDRRTKPRSARTIRPTVRLLQLVTSLTVKPEIP